VRFANDKQAKVPLTFSRHKRIRKHRGDLIMTKYKVFGFAAILFAATSLFLIPRLRGQEQRVPAKSQRKAFDETRFPLADFSAPEPIDPTERSKRRTRGQKYDRSDWAVNPNTVSDSTVRVDSVDLTLPAFPVARSKAIVIGSITEARAYLSNDKTGVYSVFTVLVDDVITNSSATSFTRGTSVEAEREGGRVKFPSGRVHLYMANELDMPEVGKRYLLFLADGGTDTGFQIITGYELREGLVYPLDHLPNMQAYKNVTEQEFLTALRKKIVNP
jgi:hypothetical protein